MPRHVALAIILGMPVLALSGCIVLSPEARLAPPPSVASAPGVGQWYWTGRGWVWMSGPTGRVWNGQERVSRPQPPSPPPPPPPPPESVASDVPAAGARLLGHPRSRFPLGVHAEPASEPTLSAALREALARWNEVFATAFGVAAFGESEHESDAAVVVRFGPATPPGHPMGETDVEGDALGVIRLPVRITLAHPVARGQTSAARVLVQVAVHELGHALGLPHVNDPASVMCCDPGGVNFDDPAVRAAYLAARRQPDLRTVLPQLVEHYRRVWHQ